MKTLCVSGEEDWRRGVWRDLRGDGHRDEGAGGFEAGVCQAVEAGPQDGGGRPEETPGYVSVGRALSFNSAIPVNVLRTGTEFWI